jgi:sarcosine oxidase subunit gamma
VSVPEPRARHRGAPGLAVCSADVVEIAAFRGRASEVESLAASHGVRLPALGEARFVAADTLALSVRPERWLLLSPPVSTGEAVRDAERIFAGLGAVLDHSSGLAAFYLAGPAWREVLKRGCRLDLDPRVFPARSAAATIIAQVPATLAALPRGLLLLTPATTARHLREWLAATAGPFGFASRPDVKVGRELLSGDAST